MFLTRDIKPTNNILGDALIKTFSFKESVEKRKPTIAFMFQKLIT